MPSIVCDFDRDIGPLLPLGVASPVPRVEDATCTHSFKALVDTGATSTIISRKVAEKVGLRPVGYWRLATASHSDVPTLAYSVDLVLDFEAGPEWRRGHLVFEFAGSPHSSFDILLGRDILCDGHLTLSLDGRVVFSL